MFFYFIKGHKKKVRLYLSHWRERFKAQQMYIAKNVMIYQLVYYETNADKLKYLHAVCLFCDFFAIKKFQE